MKIRELIAALEVIAKDHGDTLDVSVFEYGFFREPRTNVDVCAGLSELVL